jgi:outer membrane protein assembly factor BamB
VAGAAVSSDGELYIGGAATLYVFSADHRKLWQWDYPVEPHTYPEVVLQYVCVGSNGTVYVETNYGKVFALDSSGKLLWQIKVGSEWSLLSPLVADAQGQIYFCDRKELSAISRDGAILWQYRIPADPFFSFGSQAVRVIASDGNIYIARKSLFSIGPDGKDRWRFHPDTPDEYFETAPTVGRDGTVYLFSSGKQYGRMYAVSRDGKKLWSYQFHENEYANRPARFGPDGFLWKANANGFLVFCVR